MKGGPCASRYTGIGTLRYNARRGYLACRRAAATSLIDRPQNIDTAREVGLDRFGLGGNAELVRYEPSGWRTLRRILRADDIHADDVFLDIGSGKGRVLLQAAQYPFRRIIGVELAEPLTKIAAANLEARRAGLTCKDIELVIADALEYTIPKDVTMVFLYNPFRGATFERFAARLVNAVDQHARPLRLIYSTPMEHDLLIATGRFRQVREVRPIRPTAVWSRKLAVRMYELT
jgi:SAM-dependent methyltransferase